MATGTGQSGPGYGPAWARGCWRRRWVLAALLAALNWMPAGQLAAQTLTTLHAFSALGSTNADGANPLAGLILSGNTLYGTAQNGGISGSGTVFSVKTDGTGFTNLHSFSGGGDGANPQAGLILSGNALYGTARTGGSSGAGTVFSVNTDGTGFTTLYGFSRVEVLLGYNLDGANPQAGLVLSGSTLFGTAAHGGGPIAYGPPGAFGTVFSVNTDGTGFTNVHRFSGRSDGYSPFGALVLSGNTLYGTTASDGGPPGGTVFSVKADGTGFTTLHSFNGDSNGANPSAGLTLSGNTLYGTAQSGGSSSKGTVFSLNTDGTGFTTLHGFSGGSDGANPFAGLILSGDTLYGTAQSAGSSSNGTVFSVNTDGTGFTTLHSFSGGSDGANPSAGLTLSGNTLYGTASEGGTSGNGTVFSINTDGTGFTTLHGFSPVVSRNTDGANPSAGLILSGNTLYGTASEGGSSGYGTVFSVSSDGTGFTTLRAFSGGSDGANPQAGLVLSGNALYGTASAGGSSGGGTVFSLKTDGTGFTNLHNFSGGGDGANPFAGLILSGDTLYGTAQSGGSSSKGTVFSLNTDGTRFTNLHGFSGGSDGANPSAAGLTLSGNTLYGTASEGGTSGNGTVFSVNTDGTGFTTLYRFTVGSDVAYPYAGLVVSGDTLYGTANCGDSLCLGTVFRVNTDGTGFTTLHRFNASGEEGYPPNGGLVLSGNTLYGTARYGDGGTVFSVNTDGTGFKTLYRFTGGSDGADPFAGLILSGDTLYGTAQSGGSSGYGTVFSLRLPPQLLAIIRSGTNLILTWPANAAGFALQSTTNLVSPATWTTVSPGPALVNGLNTVTNPVTGAQQFYRLSQ